MSRIRSTLLVLTTALWAAGCSDWQGFEDSRQRPKPTEPVAQAPADQAPAPEEAPNTTPAEEADPHQAETVAQVLEFVDRLSAASAPGQTPTPETAAPDKTDPPRRTQPQPPTQPPIQMTANAPANVADLPTQDDGQPAETDTAPPVNPVIESLVIRGGCSDTPPEPNDQPTSAANSPLSTDPPERALTLEQRLEALTERVATAPDDLAAQWEMRLLQLVAGDQEAARGVSEETTDEYAILLRQLVDVIIATRDVLENPVTTADTALAAADALHTSLAEQADLQIPTVALCTRVQTFGVYNEMPPAALIPGRANRTIVYIEIANFFSEKTSTGQYRTALTGELEVLTAGGNPVWRHEEPNIVDLSRQRRHDFFLAQLVTLPATLGPGEYVLKVSIQDELSGKSNQAICPFSMGSTSVATASP